MAARRQHNVLGFKLHFSIRGFSKLHRHPPKAQVLAPAPTMNSWSVSFPDWKDALRRAAIRPQVKAAYTREIITFLRHCKTSHAAATTALASELSVVAGNAVQRAGSRSVALVFSRREETRERTRWRRRTAVGRASRISCPRARRGASRVGQRLR
jgi:hypothetical protein